MDISSYQSELENTACSLRDSFPKELKDDFMVMDFGFYSLHETMEGGYEAVWENVKADAASKSLYYLLFGKITGKDGVYTEFWVDLKLPDENVFFCIDQLSPNLRENLRLRYESVANEVHENNGKTPSLYSNAEIEVMEQLAEYIGGLKVVVTIKNVVLPAALLVY